METDMNVMLVFRLEDKRYGLPVAGIRKVISNPKVTPLPQTPPMMIGVTNYRNRIVPLLRLTDILREDIDRPVVLSEEQENAKRDLAGRERRAVSRGYRFEKNQHAIMIDDAADGDLFIIAEGSRGLTGFAVSSVAGVRDTEGAIVINREEAEYAYGVKVKKIVLQDPQEPQITILSY